VACAHYQAYLPKCHISALESKKLVQYKILRNLLDTARATEEYERKNYPYSCVLFSAARKKGPRRIDAGL
jgi:hypothetical protein